MSTTRSPLVSVVVPSYNYGHLIAETIESVRSQSYANWEMVVVDDGSTDDTQAVVSRWANSDSRIRYFRQENSRQAAARNQGLKQARGEYFQFLDADDLIEPRKLEQQVGFLEQQPHVDITYSGVTYFAEAHKSERLLSRQYSSWEGKDSWMPEISGTGRDLLITLLGNNIMVVNSPLMRRRVIDRVGMFDVDLTPVEDWEFLIRCAVADLRFAYEDFEDGRAAVRAHPLSASLNQPRYLRAVLKMRQKVASMDIGDDARTVNRLKAAENRGHLGVEEASAGNLLIGMSQMWKAAWADPRLRFRGKWLICAASAPFVKSDTLKRMVTSSLSRPFANPGTSQA
jgi:glycosyltransferase involved in cell wall biosynthesis